MKGRDNLRSMSRSPSLALLLVYASAMVASSHEVRVTRSPPRQCELVQPRPRMLQRFDEDWPFREYVIRIAAAGAVACSVKQLDGIAQIPDFGASCGSLLQSWCRQLIRWLSTQHVPTAQTALCAACKCRASSRGGLEEGVEEVSI